MKYTEKAIQRADRELALRRENAENEQLEREERITRELPEIGELKRSMKDDYYSLIKLVASHDSNASAAANRIKEKNLAAQRRIEELLKMHTGDAHYLDVRYACPACRDRGYIEGRRCPCMEDLLKRFTAEELNSSSAIDLHDFSEYRSDYYPESDRHRMNGMYVYLKKYCAEFSNSSCNLILTGGTGLGKTFLSSCVAKSMGEKGIPVSFMSAFDMLRTLENEHFGRAEGNTMDHLLTIDLLIIDDLGSEPPSNLYETFLYNIINGRINRKMPTIISTNLDGPAMRTKYHDRLASRVMSEYKSLRFRGDDIRQIKAIENRKRNPGYQGNIL